MILQLVGLIVRFAPALLAVSVACNLWIGVRLVATKIELASVKSDLAETMAEHAAMVAKAERERAEAIEESRRLERQLETEMDLIATRLKEANDEREKDRAAADVARDRLRLALDTIARLSERTDPDPDGSCRTHAGTLTVLRGMHEETDRFAGEAAGEADGLADQVRGLQAQVRALENACRIARRVP